MNLHQFSPTGFFPSHFLSMARHSPRKTGKTARSPVTVVDSDNDEGFEAVASDNELEYVFVI